jgi:hypothetical protein
MKSIIIYISSNDGTDTRITKEIRTLSMHHQVIFVGVKSNNTTHFLDEHCDFSYLVSGKRNRPFTILKQIALVVWLLITKPVRSIHIVNEQLAVFFWPLLFLKHTVLDVFDSIFLTKTIEPHRLLLLKRIIYAPADRIIVTDENRRALMPEFVQPKLAVLPNYPEWFETPLPQKQSNQTLTVLFFGWLGWQRGGWYVKKILEADPDLRVIMAGWFSDEACKQLAQHPRVDYRGIIPQAEALKVAAAEADYILCVYEPKNLNTINASPNKIYDGIHTQTPLIINREVKIAALVQELNIGIVVPQYEVEDFVALTKEMRNRKHGFTFSESLKRQYAWESVEQVLLNCHKI